MALKSNIKEEVAYFAKEKQRAWLIFAEERNVYGHIAGVGLDTLTPTLILGDGLKMIGEYQETIGTCYLFSETNAPPKPIHGEMAPPEENKDKQASCSKEVPSKEVKHLASVQKILKFRSINADHEQRRAYRDNEREI
uniref:OSIGBa0155K17.8 protein n=1 Tax=Oryza sativa TaxID=4530 RepID=Q00RJ2_ORYSA|nr:OSIGBa0155K17.8 [Oryza sativa]